MSQTLHILLPSTNVDHLASTLDALPARLKDKGVSITFLVQPGALEAAESLAAATDIQPTFVLGDPTDFLMSRFAHVNAEHCSQIVFSDVAAMTDDVINQIDDMYLDLRYGKGKKSRFPKVSLITSLFKADEFINSFIHNTLQLHGYSSLCNHYFFFSECTQAEYSVLLQHQAFFENVVLVWHRKDPGLYNCWNKGIQFCDTQYISNANVDDFRHPEHLKHLSEVLDLNPEAALAATAVVPFYTYVDSIDNIPESEVWYADQAGVFRFSDLARLEEDDGKKSLKPHNLPHCMPVWKRSLHEEYGYFDEEAYGTFADWAFWLKITLAGERGLLSAEPYTFYYINISSHNRRGNKLKELHKKIEQEFLPDFISATYQCLYPKEKVIWPSSTYSERKLILSGMETTYGQHRNSFSKLIEALGPLSATAPSGVHFIPFLEKRFIWGEDEGEAKSAQPQSLQSDWIGILHVPFDAPDWFDQSLSPEKMLASDLWMRSEEFCRGIICLSEDLARDLNAIRPTLHTSVAFHPTELEAVQFEPSLYLANKRILQAGDWLRKLNAIQKISADGIDKIRLLKNSSEKYIQKEEEAFGPQLTNGVEDLYFVDDASYDELLSSSVVICLLYATSANNLVLECIARSTPIMINPLPAVIEYLGPEYPLYVADESEASKAILDDELILSAHRYLKSHPYKDQFRYDSFCRAIAESSVYKNL